MMKLSTHFSLACGRRLLAGLGAAALLCAGAGTAQAQAYVGATVGGQVAPGIYGRVDIGSGGPPALLYPQPVVIAPPAVYVQRAPIYMYVPLGHAKKWSKHCARYGACGQPVYFLKEPPRGPHHFHDDRGRDHRDGHRHYDRRERENDQGNRRGHGRHDR